MMEIAEMVQAVKAYAQKNYERDGMDYIVECYSDEDIAEVIKDAKTLAEAKRLIKAEVAPRHDRRIDIEAERF